MHKDISVAVPTRHRYMCMREFTSSYFKTIPYGFKVRAPALNIIHDAPDEGYYDKSVYEGDLGDDPIVRDIVLTEKSSLTELWNWCVMLAPTDWVLICNDDVTFNEGWVEYLEEQIATDKYDMIHLFHYGGMCIHKRLILKMGWFDERFRGGGFEDIDYQLRISEAGLKDRVERSHDYIRTEGKVEVGHFMNHIRDVQANGSWAGENNASWMCEKWARRSPYNYKIPSFRQVREPDWHPSYTKKYEKKYGLRWNEFEDRIMKSMRGEELYL